MICTPHQILTLSRYWLV